MVSEASTNSLIHWSDDGKSFIGIYNSLLYLHSLQKPPKEIKKASIRKARLSINIVSVFEKKIIIITGLTID
jgi:hypothetical protein